MTILSFNFVPNLGFPWRCHFMNVSLKKVSEKSNELVANPLSNINQKNKVVDCPSEGGDFSCSISQSEKCPPDREPNEKLEINVAENNGSVPSSSKDKLSATLKTEKDKLSAAKKSKKTCHKYKQFNLLEFSWINEKKDIVDYVCGDATLEWKFKTSSGPDEVLAVKDMNESPNEGKLDSVSEKNVTFEKPEKDKVPYEKDKVPYEKDKFSAAKKSSETYHKYKQRHVICIRIFSRWKELLVLFILCMPLVRASDGPPVLGSDGCDYNCIVTHEKNKNGFKFEISCQSEWKDLKFVSLCRHSSTPIVVVSYKEGREPKYGQHYEHRASINVENRKANLTITKITPEDTRCKYVAWVGNSTCRDKITSTTQIPENRNVTDPPPVVQDEPLPPWVIFLLVVSIVAVIVSIILVIRYR
ncbi:uncharacterized protein LOC126811521 [Patella vulgata]|uniref:uncharacterized protein LOC126811521 n=1 Tax=Patella vulgata TaxID=6465 RepID=UPI00217FF897|nr:uncharacterized protein LOC126811521 [Patella vulgata]XP_050393166.1 uncharacterized protein LOC126811521 [Patella vulgata]